MLSINAMIITGNVLIVTILYISVVNCGELNETVSEAGVKEVSRSPRREIRGDQWRAVPGVQMDSSGWVPDYSAAPQQQDSRSSLQPPKRRRLRKRKRRPQVISLTDDPDTPPSRFPIRKKGPQHLLEGQDLWTQMEEDAKVRPTKRRRIIPLFHDNFGEKHVEYAVEDHISVIQADQGVAEVRTTSEATIPDLKTVLKQAGGLSLSEILQQKNLSLKDLLKGGKEAILAISEKPNNINNQMIVEYKNPVEIDAPKPTKYSSNYKTTSTTWRSATKNDNIDVSIENINTERSVTTPKVTTKLNNVIVVDFKPNIIGVDVTTTQEAQTTTTSATTFKPRLPTISKAIHRLPITSAKLNNIIKTSTNAKASVTSTTLPPKAYKINVNELFGISTMAEAEKDDGGPLRMSLDLNKALEKKIASIGAAIETTTLDILPEKLKSITAKDEIFEILKDEETRTYLKQILDKRNMTIDDLVELRERGSSQRHLADLFHNKTKEPEPKDEPLVGTIRNDIFANNFENQPSNFEIQSNLFHKDSNQNDKFKHIDRQPKHHNPISLDLKDVNGDKYVASVEVIEESNESKSIEESKDKEKYTVTSFPTYKIELDKKFKEKQPTPVVNTWKNPYPDLFDEFYQKTHQKGIVEDLNEKYFEDLNALEDIENKIAESGSESLNVETSKEVYEESTEYNLFIKLPYGVKHAIFASLLIIGISLVIFLTILMIFKWSQRRKKQLCYNGSFSCSKIKSPILQTTDGRSFRTFMSETLGRKKHYYKHYYNYRVCRMLFGRMIKNRSSKEKFVFQKDNFKFKKRLHCDSSAIYTRFLVCVMFYVVVKSVNLLFTCICITFFCNNCVLIYFY